jgi:hypothetical protein
MLRDGSRLAGPDRMATIPHVKIAFGKLPEILKSSSDAVVVPRHLLAQLVDLYICCWDFDEEWYFASYPDVRQAVRDGGFPSGWSHFRSVGYFEGRLGYKPFVDDDWYITTYPDIAQAMLEGKVTSTLEHFIEFGYKEGRLSCDPGIHSKWYVPRYMPSLVPEEADEKELLSDFLNRGQGQLAVPAPPR